MKNIIQIIKISKPLHKLILLIALLILFSSALNLVFPVISKFIVDEIVGNIQHNGGNLNRLIFLIVLSLVVNLLSLVLTTLSNRAGDHFAGRLRKFLTEKFYDKVLTLPQYYFDTETSGKISNQLSRGINSIERFSNNATNFILPTFLQSVFTIAILAYYNIPIAIFMFFLFPIFLTISYISSKKYGEYEVEKNKIDDISRGRIHEVLANIKLVKSFLTEKKEYDFVSKKLSESNAIYAKQSKYYHLLDFYRGLVLNAILFAVNIIVFYNTYIGALTIGEMVLILQLVNQARFPLFAMSFIFSSIQQAESGSKEYFEVLNFTSTENYKKRVDMKRLNNPTITFEQVGFSYDSSNTVLTDIGFTIKNNEKVALVGHSGAGKSTIINLILKFYEPTSGTISLNKEPYTQLDAQTIRNNISLVFQENELFSSTIRENVAYGNESVSDNEITKALKLANAYDFVMKLPNKLESQVGERGVRLSGGQKQRIQIARAILKNSPILILDEATSSLDAKSEKEVQDALENLMKNKLVIIIAHRFSTIQNVDKIIVINNGTVANYGNPQELSKQKGIYSELLQYQVEGNKKLLESFDIY